MKMDESDISRARSIVEELKSEIARVLVGQRKLVNGMIVALISEGHILIEGVPGLAKTTAAKTLASALGLTFNRISFTPDLLPADVIGTMIYDPGNSTFKPRQGPVFANLLLADEINRAPAKVQSALLEAMQERQVTLGDATYPLPDPFMVLATQNPIEQEGTYPLPEAQTDRFMLKCKLTYPEKDEERAMMDRFKSDAGISIKPVVSKNDIRLLREAARSVYCDPKVESYLLDIVLATRRPAEYGLDISRHIEYGASPRATLFLHRAARSLAFLGGRSYATPQDVKDTAHDVLRHRIIPTYEAEAEEIDSENLISLILDRIPVP